MTLVGSALLIAVAAIIFVRWRKTSQRPEQSANPPSPAQVNECQVGFHTPGNGK